LSELDFICDGGMHSYDNSNATRRHLISYKAHSGVFTERCESVSFKNFEKPEDAAHISLIEENENYLKIFGKSALDPDADISRKITVFNDNKLVLYDKISANYECSWRIQFLLHPEVCTNVSGSRVTLNRGDRKLNISFITGNNFEIELEDAFYSDSFMSAIPTKVIVVKGCSRLVRFRSFFSFD
jgi:hypothetical protein